MERGSRYFVGDYQTRVIIKWDNLTEFLYERKCVEDIPMAKSFSTSFLRQ